VGYQENTVARGQRPGANWSGGRPELLPPLLPEKKVFPWMVGDRTIMVATNEPQRRCRGGG